MKMQRRWRNRLLPLGAMAVVAPIPPATVSFHGTAIVHPADSPEVHSVLKELASLLPPERRA
jgi:hypothetical protein